MVFCCFKPQSPEASAAPATIAAPAPQVEPAKPDPVIAPPSDHGATKVPELPVTASKAPEPKPEPELPAPSEAAQAPEPSPPVEPVQPLKVTRAKVRQ